MKHKALICLSTMMKANSLGMRSSAFKNIVHFAESSTILDFWSAAPNAIFYTVETVAYTVTMDHHYV
ncbi:MAG: hypothetical protein RMJ07_07145 [Nitrososphaerota archaeon]|nr:hypothetical protein [Nitrososphaerota archaeon]